MCGSSSIVLVLLGNFARFRTHFEKQRLNLYESMVTKEIATKDLSRRWNQLLWHAVRSEDGGYREVEERARADKNERCVIGHVVRSRQAYQA